MPLGPGGSNGLSPSAAGNNEEDGMRSYRVGYFVGSLSSTSINRVLSRALIRLAPPDVQLTEVPIGDLPLYSPDFDQDYPP